MSGATVAQSLDLGEPVIHGERIPDCPVCGAAIIGHEDLACARCEANLHRECVTGAGSPHSAEWQEWIKNVNGGPYTFESGPTVCAQCRAKGERA